MARSPGRRWCLSPRVREKSRCDIHLTIELCKSLHSDMRVLETTGLCESSAFEVWQLCSVIQQKDSTSGCRWWPWDSKYPAGVTSA